MKTHFAHLFVLVFTVNQLFALDAPKVKFGKVGIEDLKLKVYEPDTTAEAVILYDDGQSEVKYDLSRGVFLLTFERFVRVKILKQNGTGWGNFTLRIYSPGSSREDLMSVDGITFNYDFVQHTIKWDDSHSYMPSKPLRKIFTDKTGSSSEINLILLNMLQRAGITAYPVILSTRNHGIMSPTHPTISDCNYLIVKAIIDGNPMLMDATEPNLPAGLLPFRCLNTSGVLIKKDAPENVALENAASGNNSTVLLEMVEGKLKGKIITKLSGLNAFNFRQAVKKAGGQEAYFETVKGKSEGVDYQAYTYDRLDSIYLPAEKKYDIVLESNIEKQRHSGCQLHFGRSHL